MLWACASYPELWVWGTGLEPWLHQQVMFLSKTLYSCSAFLQLQFMELSADQLLTL